jgi:DNA-directed RNA polymerase subunit RPC12/RpoP
MVNYDSNCNPDRAPWVKRDADLRITRVFRCVACGFKAAVQPRHPRLAHRTRLMGPPAGPGTVSLMVHLRYTQPVT